MDMLVMTIVALITAIIAALAAVFNKKKLRTIFVYAGVGLITGIPLGFLIAPFVISFL